MAAIVLTKRVSPPSGNSTSWKLDLTVAVDGNTTCPTTVFVFGCTLPGIDGASDSFERVIEIKDLAPMPYGVPVSPIAGGLYYRRSSALIYFDHSSDLDATFELIKKDVSTFAAEFARAQVVGSEQAETFTFAV